MKEIAAAFVKAQKNFAPALKQSVNPHFRSKYVDLAGCVEAVIDALNANGIALVQKTYESDTGVIVETVFVHESGETMDCGKLHVPASKHDAQGYGSALTYARRYSLMAACGIAPEDDDGNAATKARAPSGSAAEVKANAYDGLDDDGKAWVDNLALEVVAMIADNLTKEAVNDHITNAIGDGEQAVWKSALWHKLDSKSRSFLKKA